MSANAPFFVDNEVIILNENGIWIADGYEITHEPTRKLFSKSLRKHAAGYRLEIGKETKVIDVKDTAYFIRQVDGNSNQGYMIWVSDDLRETLKPETLKYRPGRLTCTVERHGQLEEAKFLHAPYFDFLKDLKEDKSGYFLEILNKKYYLAPR